MQRGTIWKETPEWAVAVTLDASSQQSQSKAHEREKNNTITIGIEQNIRASIE